MMQYSNTIRRTVRLAALSALAVSAWTPLVAQVSSYGDKETGQTNTKSQLLDKVGIAQHLNQQLPLNLAFTDDAGRQVKLGDYFGKRAAILALVYYQCPMLCSEELNGLTGALQMLNFRPGKDFDIIIASIDPSEGTDLAAAKKRTYVKRYGHPETADGWHFLTGTQPNIDALTKAVGFGYVKIPGPDGKLTQFAHASSIELVTTPSSIARRSAPSSKRKLQANRFRFARFGFMALISKVVRRGWTAGEGACGANRRRSSGTRRRNSGSPQRPSPRDR